MKSTSVKRLRGPAILLLALIILSSCGSARAIGQRDIDRINHDLQQAWDALDAQQAQEEEQQQRPHKDYDWQEIREIDTRIQQENRDREHQRVMEYQNQQNQYNLESQRIQSQSQKNGQDAQ